MLRSLLSSNICRGEVVVGSPQVGGLCWRRGGGRRATARLLWGVLGKHPLWWCWLQEASLSTCHVFWPHHHSLFNLSPHDIGPCKAHAIVALEEVGEAVEVNAAVTVVPMANSNRTVVVSGGVSNTVILLCPAVCHWSQHE